jgi:hypothetical protein
MNRDGEFVPEDHGVTDHLHEDNEKHVTPYFMTILRPQVGARRIIVAGRHTEALGYGEDQLISGKIQHSGLYIETAADSGEFTTIHPLEGVVFQFEFSVENLIAFMAEHGLFEDGFDLDQANDDELRAALVGALFSPEEIASSDSTLDDLRLRYNELINELVVKEEYSGDPQCWNESTQLLDNGIRLTRIKPMGFSWFISEQADPRLVITTTFDRNVVVAPDSNNAELFTDLTAAANLDISYRLPDGSLYDSERSIFVEFDRDIPWGIVNMDFNHSGSVCTVIAYGWEHDYWSQEKPPEQLQAYCQLAQARAGEPLASFRRVTADLTELATAPFGSWHSAVGLDIGHDGTLDVAFGQSYPVDVAKRSPQSRGEPIVLEDQRDDGRSATIKILPALVDGFIQVTYEDQSTRLFPTSPSSSPACNSHPIQQVTWAEDNPAVSVKILNGRTEQSLVQQR